VNNLFHLAASVDALLAAITTAWAALGEIVTAGALLLALDRLAAAIRFTYRCGHAVGTAWFRWGLPALLAAADAISAVLAEIDWIEVRDTVIAGLKVLIAATITLAITAHQLLIQLSAALGRAYAALTVREAPASKAVVTAQPCAPAVHPLALVAAGLEPLSHRQLQVITGCRRRVAKQQLIAAALAW